MTARSYPARTCKDCGQPSGLNARCGICSPNRPGTEHADKYEGQRAAAKTRAMSEVQKLSYLRDRGWRRDHGNLWQAPNGFVASFANAVRLQLLADQEDA